MQNSREEMQNNPIISPVFFWVYILTSHCVKIVFLYLKISQDPNQSDSLLKLFIVVPVDGIEMHVFLTNGALKFRMWHVLHTIQQRSCRKLWCGEKDAFQSTASSDWPQFLPALFLFMSIERRYLSSWKRDNNWNGPILHHAVLRSEDHLRVKRWKAPVSTY